MPRKTLDLEFYVGPPRRRFNEAAARCRGKHSAGVPVLRGAGASMRPRPDAAENPVLGHAPRHADMASMRPRPDAAENAQETPGGGQERAWLQ